MIKSFEVFFVAIFRLYEELERGMIAKLLLRFI
jgi:hypothetical protein